MNNPNQHDPRDIDDAESLFTETTAGCAILLLGGIAAVLIAFIILISFAR